MLRLTCVIALAMVCTAVIAQDQATIYNSAVQQYEARQYEESCNSFRQLYESSSKFDNLDATIVDKEKASLIRGFDWQNKAFASQNGKQWAKECAEWYHGAVGQVAANKLLLVKGDVESAQKAEKHLAEEKQGPGRKSSSAEHSRQ